MQGAFEIDKADSCESNLEEATTTSPNKMGKNLIKKFFHHKPKSGGARESLPAGTGEGHGDSLNGRSNNKHNDATVNHSSEKMSSSPKESSDYMNYGKEGVMVSDETADTSTRLVSLTDGKTDVIGTDAQVDESENHKDVLKSDESNMVVDSESPAEISGSSANRNAVQNSNPVRMSCGTNHLNMMKNTNKNTSMNHDRNNERSGQYESIPLLEIVKLPRGGISLFTEAVGYIQVSSMRAIFSFFVSLAWFCNVNIICTFIIVWNTTRNN